MSEQLEAQMPTRTIQIVEQEYYRACAQLGDIAYRIAIFKEEDMPQLVLKMKQLNKEAAELKQKEAEIPAKAVEAEVV